MRMKRHLVHTSTQTPAVFVCQAEQQQWKRIPPKPRIGYKLVVSFAFLLTHAPVSNYSLVLILCLVNVSQCLSIRSPNTALNLLSLSEHLSSLLSHWSLSRMAFHSSLSHSLSASFTLVSSRITRKVLATPFYVTWSRTSRFRIRLFL